MDYRSGGGTQDQSRVTKEEQLYRQDYCGCIFGLTMQREQQNRLMDEMFSPLSGAILPASIEERLALYRERNRVEEQLQEYKIIKQKFLNYRQLSFKLIKGKRESVDAYALSYSTLSRGRAQGRVEYNIEEIYYFNREEIIFVTLAYFNKQNSTNYSSIKELIYKPLSYDEEFHFRMSIEQTNYALSPIIVVAEVPEGKLTITLDAKTYEDSREKLIIL